MLRSNNQGSPTILNRSFKSMPSIIGCLISTQPTIDGGVISKTVSSTGLATPLAHHSQRIDRHLLPPTKLIKGNDAFSFPLIQWRYYSWVLSLKGFPVYRQLRAEALRARSPNWKAIKQLNNETTGANDSKSPSKWPIDCDRWFEKLQTMDWFEKFQMTNRLWFMIQKFFPNDDYVPV